MGHRDLPSPQEANSVADGAWMQALASWSPKNRPPLSRTGTPRSHPA